MLAVVADDFAGPEALYLGELPAPEPGPEEVLIEIAAAGLNFADTLMVAGKYQHKPEPPFAPGLEGAGTVLAVGASVSHVAPGDRVMAVFDAGAMAERAVARASDVFKIPETMDFTTAAGFAVTYGTAHGALTWYAGLKPGETLVVHGAAGGVGLAAVEVGKALGARVVATAGGAEKLALAKAHGADALIDYRQEDLRDRIKDLTDGRGADVVFDPVGGKVFDASLRAIAWGGRLLIVGFAGGEVQQIPANILLVKSVAVLGVYWGSWRKHEPEALARQYETLFGWWVDGKLMPHVSEVFSFAEAGQAMARLTSRKATGKIVLTPTR